MSFNIRFHPMLLPIYRNSMKPATQWTHSHVLQAPRRSAAQPLLEHLHWLPVYQRIDSKLAVLTYKIRATPYHHTSAITSDLGNIHVNFVNSIHPPCRYSTDRLREHISPIVLSDVVHLLSGTRWTLKHDTVALLADLSTDLKHRFSVGYLNRTFTRRHVIMMVIVSSCQCRSVLPRPASVTGVARGRRPPKTRG